MGRVTPPGAWTPRAGLVTLCLVLAAVCLAPPCALGEERTRGLSRLMWIILAAILTGAIATNIQLFLVRGIASRTPAAPRAFSVIRTERSKGATRS